MKTNRNRKKNHLPEFLCTALRRSHINCRWYQNTELAINRPTCLLLIQNQFHNVYVRVPFEIYNKFKHKWGLDDRHKTTVLVIDLPNTKIISFNLKIDLLLKYIIYFFSSHIFCFFFFDTKNNSNSINSIEW